MVIIEYSERAKIHLNATQVLSPAVLGNGLNWESKGTDGLTEKGLIDPTAKAKHGSRLSWDCRAWTDSGLSGVPVESASTPPARKLRNGAVSLLHIKRIILGGERFHVEPYGIGRELNYSARRRCFLVAAANASAVMVMVMCLMPVVANIQDGRIRRWFIPLPLRTRSRASHLNVYRVRRLIWKQGWFKEITEARQVILFYSPVHPRMHRWRETGSCRQIAIIYYGGTEGPVYVPMTSRLCFFTNEVRAILFTEVNSASSIKTSYSLLGKVFTEYGEFIAGGRCCLI